MDGFAVGDPLGRVSSIGGEDAMGEAVRLAELHGIAGATRGSGDSSLGEGHQAKRQKQAPTLI
eukprot:10050318-Lingulodinium_polyedra.AAC.1